MTKRSKRLAKLSYKLMYWVGSPASIIVHTIGFIVSFALIPLAGIDRVMLIVTTAVSLEAIYLSLFIQMAVNRSHKTIRELADDIDDILEDTEELTEEDKTELKRILKKQ